MTPFPIGSQWRTRAGHRAVVVDVEKTGPIVWHTNDKCTRHHRNDGTSANSISLDLLTPWTEPQKGEFWVNIYDGMHGALHSSKKNAEANAIGCDAKCIARIRIVWEEGQFDE